RRRWRRLAIAILQRTRLGQRRGRGWLGRPQRRRWRLGRSRRWRFRRAKIGFARPRGRFKRQGILAGRHRKGLVRQQPIPYRENGMRVALNRKLSISRLGKMAIVFGALLPLVACNTSKVQAPAETGPKTFATPEDAGAALVAATK